MKSHQLFWSFRKALIYSSRRLLWFTFLCTVMSLSCVVMLLDSDHTTLWSCHTSCFVQLSPHAFTPSENTAKSCAAQSRHLLQSQYLNVMDNNISHSTEPYLQCLCSWGKWAQAGLCIGSVWSGWSRLTTQGRCTRWVMVSVWETVCRLVRDG